MDKLKDETEHDEIDVVFFSPRRLRRGADWLVDDNLHNALSWGVFKMDLAQGLGPCPYRGPHAPGFAAEESQAIQTSRGHSCCSPKAHTWQDPPSSS